MKHQTWEVVQSSGPFQADFQQTTTGKISCSITKFTKYTYTLLKMKIIVKSSLRINTFYYKELIFSASKINPFLPKIF